MNLTREAGKLGELDKETDKLAPEAWISHAVPGGLVDGSRGWGLRAC